MWSGFLVRFPAPHDDGRPARIESCPPAALPSRPGWADRLLDWLARGGYAAPSRDLPAGDDEGHAPAGVASVRQDFLACLDDITTRQAADLAGRVLHARSLRELWHLRTEVFSVVSCHADQSEAKARLARLNRHFPMRAPRSGFGGFDAEPHTTHD